MAQYPSAEKIYEVAALFADECLIRDGSLLWPSQQIWTLENLEQFWTAFAENPDLGDDSFIEKWSNQLSGQSDQIYRMAVEVTAIYCLFPHRSQFGPKAKLELIDQVRSMGPSLGDVDQQRWALLLGAIDNDGIGRAGPDYLSKRPFHIGFYLAAALEAKRREVSSLNKIDPVELVDYALGWSAKTMNFTANGSRNAFLHIFWPDDYEATASNNHKSRMAANLATRYGLNPLEHDDQTILLARRHMEDVEGFPTDFNMYSDDVRPLWDMKSPAPKRSGSSKRITNPPPKQTSDQPTINDLAEKTFLDQSFLQDIESLLTSKQQLIFEGPPGSGKTYVAEQFARYFTGQALDDSQANDQIELVQFHQSYSYEDFVEGIRPRTNDDGQLVYDVEPGIFREFAERADLNRDKNFVLIIDEINRGNVSRILGELMLLLEYRDKSATLPYSKDQLQIPANLYIIGTMNTADRSLSQIDYALRRRFYFVRFMSVENGEAHVLNGWLRQQGLDSATHSTVLQSFIALNQQLETDLGTDDLQVGHSYFMDQNIHTARNQQHIWTYAVLPLIREYLYHHRERDNLLLNYQLERIMQVAKPVIDDQDDSDAFSDSRETPE